MTLLQRRGAPGLPLAPSCAPWCPHPHLPSCALRPRPARRAGRSGIQKSHSRLLSGDHSLSEELTEAILYCSKTGSGSGFGARQLRDHEPGCTRCWTRQPTQHHVPQSRPRLGGIVRLSPLQALGSGCVSHFRQKATSARRVEISGAGVNRLLHHQLRRSFEIAGRGHQHVLAFTRFRRPRSPATTGSHRDRGARRHPPRGRASDAAYLPREVFFGRLGLAGVFFSLWATDFGRFFPATAGSFQLSDDRNRVTVPPSRLAQSCERGHPPSRQPSELLLATAR